MAAVELIDVQGGRTAGAAPRTSKAREARAWLGLLPFLLFLLVFLLLPSYGVVRKAFIANDGTFTWTGISDAITKESAAFKTSLKVSIVTALLGVVFGTLLAYAAATATRPRWLRSLVSAFSGVAANMGGIVLAFAFFTLLGRQGLGTKLMSDAGYNLYDTDWFDLTGFWGWSVVYMYFQVPLMVLVPRSTGIRAAGQRAC